MPRFLLSSLLALPLFASPAHATTWIVDAGGGGQFTDIPAAILASSPGDVLLVQAGYYSTFTLDRGVSIIGYGICTTSGPISIIGIPAGQTAALVKIETQFLSIQSCDGHVFVQEMQQPVGVAIDNCADVRLARIAWGPVQVDPPAAGLHVGGNSRVEIADSSVAGEGGMDCVTPAQAGGFGVSVSSSRLHLTRTSIVGGHGAGCSTPNFACGFGGVGMDLVAGADVIACGSSGQTCVGGQGGMSPSGSGCWDDVPGCPVVVHSGGALRWSGISIPTFYSYMWGPSCATFIFPGIDNQGGTVTTPTGIDPYLVVSGTPQPGSTVNFALHAPVGATAVLSFGRNPVVQPDPNSLIEVLVPPLRNVNLGTVGTSGVLSFNWPISPVLQPGTRLIAQARITLPGGEVRRTNSAPVIVR